MGSVHPGTPTFYVYILVIIGLVLFAGMMSGLTLGLMSLGLVDLEVLRKSGQPADRKHAGNYRSLSLSLSFCEYLCFTCAGLRFFDFCLSVL
jgi:metal transporter CNNM